MKKLLIALMILPQSLWAAEPVIKAANAQMSGGGWNFSVTLEHPDSGWDHYADGWQVESEDGTVLGYRTLHHPHVNEQPFTRSLGGVEIPAGVTSVYIRSHCLVDGFGKSRFEVKIDN